MNDDKPNAYHCCRELTKRQLDPVEFRRSGCNTAAANRQFTIAKVMTTPTSHNKSHLARSKQTIIDERAVVESKNDSDATNVNLIVHDVLRSVVTQQQRKQSTIDNIDDDDDDRVTATAFMPNVNPM